MTSRDTPRDSDYQPLLPYAGSSGWSGSETSRERADRDDSSGVTGKRQREVLRLLDMSGERGITWHELGVTLDLHHGAASGVLSGLHRVGRVARLDERRHRCKVYVLPQYVAGRATEPYRRNKQTPAEQTLGRAKARLRVLIDAGDPTPADLRGLLALLEENETERGSE